jgi:hypothetical protein
LFSKITKQDYYIYSGLFLIAFAVVFISCLNPFGLRNIDSDTSVYLTIAQGITRGQVPFRDFFDNKGPLTYLISAPGMFFGGFTGVWITEFIFMLVSVLFAYKTALFFGDKNIAFWGVVCSFIYFQTFFYEVAGTEEYSLPFMMISLYIFIKYFFTQKDPPVYELIILGFCCAVNILIRINHFPLWLGFCVIIVVEALLKHKFLSLLKYIVFFCAGILIAAIPVFLYLYLNNAFSDYIYQNFFMGSSMAFNNASIILCVKSFVQIYGKNYSFLPFPVFFIWIVKKQRNINIFLSFGLLLAYLLTIFFLAVTRLNLDHYNMILTPFLVPVFTFCAKFVFDYFSNVKYKNIVLVCFLCIIFAESLSFWSYACFYTLKDTSRKELITAGKIIDQNTGTDDTVISLDKFTDIYLFTERQSASRYIYQASGIKASGIKYYSNSKNEFLKCIQENKPKIIAIREEDGRYDHLSEWYLPVYDMIAQEYRLLSSGDGYFLFIR